MPSWNIHIAHAEGLLEDGGPFAGVVRDRNAFLFGNFVPDIYVGYMVPSVAEPIPYRVTHFAAPEHIPKPREAEFWHTYVAPMAHELGITDVLADGANAAPGASAGRTIILALDDDVARGCTSDAAGRPTDSAARKALIIEAGSLAREVAHVSPAHTPNYELKVDPALTASLQVQAFEAVRETDKAVDARRSQFDMVLGTWTYLLADTIWNQRVSDFLDELGQKPSRDFRIKKQGDFDQFGKSLRIDAFPVATPRLLDAAAAFPQYAIDECSVLYTVAIAHEILRTNSLVGEPEYRLLTSEFFAQTFNEVQRTAANLIRERL